MNRASLPVSPPLECPECFHSPGCHPLIECSVCGDEACRYCIQSDPRFDGEICPACLHEADEWEAGAVDLIQALVDIVAGVDGPESIADAIGRME